VHSRMRVDQCVCAVRTVEVPVLAPLNSRYSEVTEVGRTLKFFDIYSHYSHAKL